MTNVSPVDGCRFTVGLTGGIGSGKSTVADQLAKLGANIVDTDVIAHELTAPGGAAIDAIKSAFGPQVVDGRGALDRAAMRQIVFADASARARLEAILHPEIRRRAAQLLQAASGAYSVLVVPLLQESSHFQGYCDRVLVVDCPEAQQVSRVLARSGMAENEVRRIIAAQASRDERRAIADDIIDNSGDFASLLRNVNSLHEFYIALAQQGTCGSVI